ncbi:DoxX family protein [Undibacterium terreum]|uniref:Quinol oxidase n=1 Tax=Undibacterium terreum TaxID=1224302 RepID=A0A916UZJ4_9BURK|nr:DoxX family protein [Undibacterium terreum]GGC95772.1 quinol oxidase [Undibacterium terreum]
MNDRNTNIAASLLRVSFGVILLAHALLKVLVFTLPGTVAFFASQGFPGWMAYPVVAVEFFGGAALLLGFQTRLVALATLPVMLGALTVHMGNGWVFNAPNGGWEYPALLAVLAVVVALQSNAGVTLSKAGISTGAKAH